MMEVKAEVEGSKTNKWNKNRDRAEFRQEVEKLRIVGIHAGTCKALRIQFAYLGFLQANVMPYVQQNGTYPSSKVPYPQQCLDIC